MAKILIDTDAISCSLDTLHWLCTHGTVLSDDAMVAMLTELKKEIEELQGKYSPYYDEASQHISELIQQKINNLKED